MAENLAFGFDCLFHWTICHVYLKAALVLPYLFNRKLYSDNLTIHEQYCKTQKRVKWLNYTAIGAVLISFCFIIPMYWLPRLMYTVS